MPIGTKRSLVVGFTLLGSATLSACVGQDGQPSLSAPHGFASGASESAEIEFGTRMMIGIGLGKDSPAGFAVLRRLGDSGNPIAESLVAQAYLQGNGVERDPKLAVDWFKKSADRGFAEAKSELAFIYMRGLGVPRDYDRARKFAEEAAAKDNASGMTALGMLYSNGWGVAKDQTAGFNWYRKAAKLREGVAMQAIGIAYRDGTGVTADRVVAYAWFDAAARSASSNQARLGAMRSRDELAVVMTSDDVALARKLAASWKPGDDLEQSKLALAKEGAADKGGATSPGAAGDHGSDLVVASEPAGAEGVPMNAADIPVVERKELEEMELKADDSRVSTFHTEIEIKNESAIGYFSQRPIRFNSTVQDLEIVDAFTLKPDGRKIQVDRTAIFEQAVPGSAQTPIYDDQKQKVVIFPEVEVGDVLVTTARYKSRAIIPGLFALDRTYDRSFAQNDVLVRVTVPKDRPLYTETHEVAFSKHAADDKIIYEWRYANPRPMAQAKFALDPIDRAPRIFASTLPSYERLARTYAEIAAEKTVLTPEIRTLADEITKGIGDRRQQAEAIYYWVSRHIRYVAIELGRGSIVPHDAASVLANRYGDCKDHSALLVALLKAKDIKADIVLINYGASYSTPGPPTFSSLNHAITYLPEFDLFVDSTAGVAPFGVLPFGEYGKSVVVATASGQAVRKTPSLRTDDATITLKTTMKLEADGRLVGDSESVATGPFAIWIRQMASTIQTYGSEQVAARALKTKGFEGKGRFEFGSPFEPGPSFRIAGHFETDRHPELLSGNSFTPIDGLSLGARPGELLAGPIDRIDLRPSEPTPCYGGREIEEITIEVPKDRVVRELPKGTEFENKVIKYKSTWSQVGSAITVRREFTSLTTDSVCVGEARAIAARSLNDIRIDYAKAIALAGG